MDLIELKKNHIGPRKENSSSVPNNAERYSICIGKTMLQKKSLKLQHSIYYGIGFQ